MYSIIISLVFIAFLLLYNLSKKSKWDHKPSLAKSLESNKLLSRAMSAVLMLAAVVLLIVISGTGAGIFTFLVILMAMGNLIVLLLPFRYVTAKHLGILFVAMLIFEHFIF